MGGQLYKHDILTEPYIKNMLNDFYKLTNTYIEVIDKNGNLIMKSDDATENSFCKCIKENELGIRKCMDSYKVACKEAFKWKEPYFLRCHSGLVMWCIPIAISNKNIATIICGKALLWEADEFTYQEIRQFTKELDNFEILKEHIDKIPVIPSKKFQSMSNIISTLVEYIIKSNDDYMSEQKNILEWKNNVRIEIQSRKKENPNIYSNYEAYFRKERKLLQYMRIGEKEKAIQLLPSIFTDISFLSNYNHLDIKVRCIELLSLISRALIEAGLDSQLVMSQIEKYCKNIHNIESMETIFMDIQNIVYELVEFIFILGKDRHTSLLKRARQYIVENYYKNIIIEDVAEHVLISASYLSSLFKSKLNCTVNEYITRVRVEESIELMNDRSLSIQEIANNVGFSSASHFTKVFKKYLGVTPIHYRNKFL